MSYHPSSSAPLLKASIVVPAYNEETGIQRLLYAVLGTPSTIEFEVIVVCNGCTDGTASAARSWPQVHVIELDQPSKSSALRVGDEFAHVFPRFFADADVVVSESDLRTMIASLTDSGVLAVAPARVLSTIGVSRLVRAYYRVWEKLPQVHGGLFGRGVIGFSALGHERIANMPEVISDDLVISEAFAPNEAMIVPAAHVVIYPPKTLMDLVRRRIRVSAGNAQFDSIRGRRDSSRTSLKGLARMVQSEPRLAPNVIFFLAVALISRIAASKSIRKGDFTSWNRDASSRRG